MKIILLVSILESHLMVTAVTCWCNKTLLNQFNKSNFITNNGNDVSFNNGLNVLKDCQPWIKKSFPQCWHVLRMISNGSEILHHKKNKCFTSCNIFLHSCPMLEHFSTTRSYFSACFDKTPSLQHCLFEKVLNNTVPKCKDHFIRTSHKFSWIISWQHNGEKQGCSLACAYKRHIFKSGQLQVDGPIITMCLLGMVAACFTIMSFLIDWNNQKRYPALILFIMNVCSAFTFLGWLVQFFGLKNKISCNSEGLIRNNEPRHGASFWCVLSFMLIYSSTLAWCFWFAILNYAWFISFCTMGSIRTVIRGKIKYFHTISWGATFGFTFMVLAMQTIGSNPVTGICFVESEHLSMHDSLVTLPITISVLVGEFFYVRNIIQLTKLRGECSEFLVPKAVGKLSKTLYRMLICGIGTTLSMFLMGFTYYYEKSEEENWKKSLWQYISCVIQHSHFPDETASSLCTLKNNYKMLIIHTQLFVLFFVTTLTSSWTWNKGTLGIWKKAWKRYFVKEKGVEKQLMQKSWYRRIHNKKISPFLPPVNPENPFAENNFEFMRREIDNKRFSLPNTNESFHRCHRRYSNATTPRKRHSEDIRSVAELFSKRRNTACSLHSFTSNMSNDLEALRKSISIQSFGHLSIAKNNNLHNDTACRPASNLTIVQVHRNIRKYSEDTAVNLRRRRQPTFDGIVNDNSETEGDTVSCSLDEFLQLRDQLSKKNNVNTSPVHMKNSLPIDNNHRSHRNKTQSSFDTKERFLRDCTVLNDGAMTPRLDDILRIRDKLYTPLVTADRNSIVADCVPYGRTDVDGHFISSAVGLRKVLRSRAASPQHSSNKVSISSTKL